MCPTASEIHRSVLKEIGNIGAGHAATALASLMGLTVGLTEPSVDTLQMDPGARSTDRGDRQVAALQMAILGDAPAEMVIIFDREESVSFVRRFMEQQVGEVELTSDVISSALREIANIIGGSYLTAIVDMIGIELLPSTPKLSYGSLDEILASVMSEAEPTSDREAFLINNGFINERGAINAEFMLIPHDGSLESYLQAFGLGA